MLKNIIIAASLIATPLAAETSDQDLCVRFGETAGLIMENRQVGTPISTLMEIADGNELMIELIMEAYDSPRYSTPGNQANAVLDFANEAMSACYRIMSR